MAHNLTIGLAVGFGVGIPILATIAILTWVSIRHNRKMREEDERDEKIDLLGEVTFYDKEETYQNSLANSSAFMSFDTTAVSDPGSMLKSPSYAVSYVPSRRGSVNTVQTAGAGKHEDAFGQQPLSIYTPSMDDTKDERQLNSVYGPSPAYPSSDRLRSSSSIHSFSRFSAPDTPRRHSGSGPFATPPRRTFGERRFSSSSVGSSIGQLTQPVGALCEAPEPTPHPYAEMAGEVSLDKSGMDVRRPNDISEHRLKKTVDDREKGKHYYHQQAENRQSVFEYTEQ